MAQIEQTPKLLNVKQMAQYLAVPVRTLRYWLKNNRCPVQPIDGMKPPKWRVADVEKFLAGRK